MRRTVLPLGWIGVTDDCRSNQLDLLPKNRDEFLAIASVSLDEIQRWRAKQWISFDASKLEVLDECLCHEIIFIRNLAQSGLPDPQIEQLLRELTPPYRYHPTRTAYSFAYGWVQIPMMPDPDELDSFVEEQLPNWIRQQAALHEFGVLESLKQRIVSAIALFARDDEPR